MISKDFHFSGVPSIRRVVFELEWYLQLENSLLVDAGNGGHRTDDEYCMSNVHVIG